MTLPPKPWLGLLAGFIVCVFLAVVMLAIYQWDAGTAYFWSVLIGTGGAMGGWLLGFLASPYTGTEEKRSTKYAQR